MSCELITLKGQNTISQDRIIINRNFQCLNDCLEEIDTLIQSGSIGTTSDNVSNESNVDGDTVTSALNTLLNSISQSNSLIVVDLLADLPGAAAEGNMALVRNIEVKSTPVIGLYIFDSLWRQIIREDANTYITDLDDGIASPGIEVPVGTTVAQIKGKTFSEFVDEYVFPTIEATISYGESGSLPYSGSPSTVEVGTLLDITLTANFQKGLIQNGDGSSGPDLVGNPSQYEFTGPGIATSVVVVSSNLTEIIDTSNPGFSTVPAVFGAQNWTVDIDFDAGTGAYFDSKGATATNLDASRVAGNDVTNSPSITGRYYAFYDVGSIPVDSAGVRSASNTIFLSASNTGSFTINIPSGTPEVFFSVPAGKTVQVNYVESSNADVTGSFSSNTFNVDDAGGNPVSYDTWSTTIGGGGYPADATYNVVIS